jgi:hypothetical protein
LQDLGEKWLAAVCNHWQSARRADRNESAAPPEFDSRHYREGAARIEFSDPVPLSQLTAADEHAMSRWAGYLSRGSITLLSAFWKSGKSTLLTHLVKAAERGGELCGLKVEPCQLLVVSEEPDGLWVARRDQLHIGDHAHLIGRPFKTKASFTEWADFLAHLEKHVRQQEFALVSF